MTPFKGRIFQSTLFKVLLTSAVNMALATVNLRKILAEWGGYVDYATIKNRLSLLTISRQT